MCQPVQTLSIIFLQHPGLTKMLNNEAKLATITNLRGLITVAVKLNAMHMLARCYTAHTVLFCS